jgi:hypothetical protein
MKLVALLLLASCAPALGGESARDILDRRKALDGGPRNWTGRQERLRLTTQRNGGTPAVRGLVVLETRDASDVRKTMLLLEEPALERGMAFLSQGNPKGADEQRLLLTGQPRSRVVTGSDRSGPFFASALSFADVDLLQELPPWTEDDAASSLRGEEAVDGVPCHVIVLERKRTDIVYPKIVLWLGKDDLVPRKLQFFADGAAPTKELLQRDVVAIDGIPVARRVEVDVPAKHAHSTIESRDVRFERTFPPSFFTSASMERGPSRIREQIDGGGS